MTDIKRLYTSEEVAELLGVKPGTFNQWRAEGRAPQHIKLNRLVRYTAESVMDWLREQNPGQIAEQEKAEHLKGVA